MPPRAQLLDDGLEESGAPVYVRCGETALYANPAARAAFGDGPPPTGAVQCALPIAFDGAAAVGSGVLPARVRGEPLPIWLRPTSSRRRGRRSPTPGPARSARSAPGLDGHALAVQVLARQPSAKVVFMSGYTEHAAIKNALGPDDHFVQKPFSSAELSQAIRRALDG